MLEMVVPLPTPFKVNPLCSASSSILAPEYSILHNLKFLSYHLTSSPPYKIDVFTSDAELLLAPDCLLKGAFPLTIIPPQSPDFGLVAFDVKTIGAFSVPFATILPPFSTKM